MRAFLAAACLLMASSAVFAAEAPKAPVFVEETQASGLDSTYAGEWQYMVGGGVATFDCNEDGFPDMVLAGGTAPAKFYRNISEQGGPLRFEAETSGLELDQVTGAYPLDIDSDGIQDVVLLRVGENVLMRGKGSCRFERANEAWGFDGGDGWSTAFAATFERGESRPTLAIGNYIDRTKEFEPWGSCTDNWLHRPMRGDGGGARKFAPPLPLKPSFCPLSMLFTDWDRSGTPSLRVSNDREYYEGGQEQMWKIEPGKDPVLYTESEGWKYLRIWGMGIASYDLDFDGYPEFFLTSMADQKLQTLANVPKDGKPQPSYKDVAYAKGVTAHRPVTGDDLRPSTGWHAQFEDVNNDGLADLFIAKGNVAEMKDFAMKDPNNLFLQRQDGTFLEAAAAAGVGSIASSRGASLADFNLDGSIDLVVVNRGSKAQLWRNTSADLGHWIEVKLLQQGTNRDAIGAWIEVKRGDVVMRREITSGGGHVSGHSGWWHFGLGDAKDAQVRVIWPDGTVDPWQTLAANSFYGMERASPAKKWAVK